MDKETLSAESEEAQLDQSTWAFDQKQRDYYYDDAHGYEIYNPDEEEAEEDED